MSVRIMGSLATDQWRLLVPIAVISGAALVCAPARAAELATVEVEIQVFDFDTGTVIDPSPEDLTEPEARSELSSFLQFTASITTTSDLSGSIHSSGIRRDLTNDKHRNIEVESISYWKFHLCLHGSVGGLGYDLN